MTGSWGDKKDEVLPLLLLSSPGCMALFLCLCSRYSLMVMDVSIVIQISDSHFVFFHQHHPITSKSNIQVSLQLCFPKHTYQTGKSLRLHGIISLALLSLSDYLCNSLDSATTTLWGCGFRFHFRRE